MAHSITRKIECDIGHRIPDHGSACRNIHGHRYVIEATCVSDKLITDGSSKDMVLDFSFLKDEMVKHIHNYCDHALILSNADPLLEFLLIERTVPSQEYEGEGWKSSQCDFGKLYIINASPTAEVLAEHWFNRLKPRVAYTSNNLARLQSVKVYETPNCWAVYPASGFIGPVG